MRRIILLGLSVVMMLYPLTGSAVTWSEVESALQTSGSYSGDGVTAVCGDDSIEISGGTVDTLWLVSTKFPSVKTYRILPM